MVSLEKTTPGLMQANAMVEIDPGPPMVLAHEFAHLLGFSGPHMTSSTSATEAHSPPTSLENRPEPPLEHIFGGEHQPTGVGCDGKFAMATEGSHMGTKDHEGGITFKRPGYPCPFSLRLSGAITEEETFGTWMGLRKHLSMSDKCLCRQSGAYATGKDFVNDKTPGQAMNRTKSAILPLPAHANADAKALGSATSVGRGEHAMSCLSTSVDLVHKSYESVAIGSGRGGVVARAPMSWTGENLCARQGGQIKWLGEYPNRTKHAPDERKWSKERALHDFGDKADGENSTGLYDLTCGKGQHASLRNGLGGNRLLSANGFVEAEADVPRLMTAWSKETRDNLPGCDNVKNRTTSKGLMVGAEKSFVGKTEGSNRAQSTKEEAMIESSLSFRFMVPETTSCLMSLASTSWGAGPPMNSVFDLADCSVRKILMWMIEYNLITSPSGSESLARLWNQSTELLFNLVAAAISCFHVHFPVMVQRTNVRAKQCTGKVHCLLEDPG